MPNVDITVRGAGLFGLAVAWAALGRDAKVRVVDPAGVASGASGGVVGALAPHAPERWSALKAFQLEALLGAETYWAAVEACSGLSPGYAREGRVIPLADAAAVARAEAQGQSAESLWGGRASWRVREGAADTWEPAGPVVAETLSARLEPRWAAESLAAAIRARGGAIVGEAPDSGAVVWATGWRGLLGLSETLGRPAGHGIKGQALRLGLDARGRPQLSAAGLHIVPHADGTVAVGSTSERDFDDPDATDDQLDALLERAAAACPALAGRPVVERWAGVRPRAATRGPLLGPWPGRPGHWIANGGFKIGLALAPLAGERLAAAVLDGADAIPPEFLPDRLL